MIYIDKEYAKWVILFLFFKIILIHLKLNHLPRNHIQGNILSFVSINFIITFDIISNSAKLSALFKTNHLRFSRFWNIFRFNFCNFQRLNSSWKHFGCFILLLFLRGGRLFWKGETNTGTKKEKSKTLLLLEQIYSGEYEIMMKEKKKKH